MSKLPSEILRDKYVPIHDIKEHLPDVSLGQIHELIKSDKIRYAEMKAPGARLRTLHVNPEEIICILRGEKYE